MAGSQSTTKKGDFVNLVQHSLLTHIEATQFIIAQKYVATGWIEYADLYNGKVKELYQPEDGNDQWAYRMYRTCDNDRDKIQSNKQKPYKRLVDLN